MAEDWRKNPATITIVEFALRSVIRAHPSDDDEGQRLRSAMKALFGIAPPKGKPAEPDLEELLFMARGYADDRGPGYSLDTDYTPKWPKGAGQNARSKTALATAAIEMRQQNDAAYKPHNPNEKARTLVEKFKHSKGGLLRLVVGWGGDGASDVFVGNTRHLSEVLDLLGIPVEDVSEANRELNAPN